MGDLTYQLISLDLPPILTALFSALACALLGNYLLLQRQSLMGDAVSHAVLPGIVIAFLLSNSRSSLTVFIGAAIAGILSAVLIGAIRQLGLIESGAAMGVVFSIFFALGVFLMEQAAARNVDLDADCLLYGQLETIFWSPPQEFTRFFTFETAKLMPGEVWASLATFLFIVGFVLLFYKELKIFSFDPGLAITLGFSPTILHYVFMSLTAFAVVASFKAVGSILVIAMIICPAASARLFTDKLHTQIWLSILFCTSATIIGYISGAFLPVWLGFEQSLNAAGTMSVVLGAQLAAAVLFAPTYGVLSQRRTRARLARQILCEDILSITYRSEERLGQIQVPRSEVAEILKRYAASPDIDRAWQNLLNQELIIEQGEEIELSASGREQAKSLLRRHRLWETHLVNQAGLKPDHVHQTAETLEHFTTPELTEELAATAAYPNYDPHGKKIP